MSARFPKHGQTRILRQPGQCVESAGVDPAAAVKSANAPANFHGLFAFFLVTVLRVAGGSPTVAEIWLASLVNTALLPKATTRGRFE